MATEIILPALGETMDEGTIARWMVESGASVSKGQAIAEIESNKAVFELESPANGILHITTPAGQTVPILTPIAALLQPGEQAQAEPVATKTTDNMSRPAPQATLQDAPIPGASGETGGRRFVSPRARRFAGEEGVDVSQVRGSGPNGRVEERDVRSFLEQQPRVSPLARKKAAEAGIAIPTTGLAPRARVTSADLAGSPERQASPAEARPAKTPAEQPLPITAIRRVIAQRMSQSAQSAAAVTLTSEVDATELVHLREQLKAHVEAQTGQPLSYNVLFAKLVAVTLREMPYMMSRLSGDLIHMPAKIDIGVAVDAERGLLVPVLRSVDSTGLVALSQQMAELANKARSGAIGADDMAGGVFTITNLGMYGVDAFTPIINLPECAILGVGRIVQKPAVWQGQIAVRSMLALSLTFDHRLVDGAPAARFLQRLAQLVQNPYIVLL